MENQDNAWIVKAYLKGCNTRTELSNVEHDEEIQYMLQTFLTAGDEARAVNDQLRAERFYHETIKLAIREFDNAIPEVALAKFHLSMLYLDRGSLVAAEAFATSALEVFMEVFGESHPATGMAMHQLSEVHLAQHKTEAASLQKQAAKILAQTYGEYRSDLHSQHLQKRGRRQTSKAGNLQVNGFENQKQTVFMNN